MNQVIDKRKLNFTIVENEIIDSKDFDIYEKMTYIVLCRMAKDGQCFPSYNTIADKVGCGRKKVIECIKKLIESKLIQKESRKNEYDENTSNMYYICGIEENYPSISETPPQYLRNTTLVSQEHPNNTNINNTNITTTTANPNTSTTEEISTVPKDVVVALNTKIESTIKAKVKVSDTENLINQVGVERIEYYLENWEKFKVTSKGNVVGFFKKACIDQYNLPVAQLGTNTNNIPQHTNFEQRSYDDLDESLYISNRQKK